MKLFKKSLRQFRETQIASSGTIYLVGSRDVQTGVLNEVRLSMHGKSHEYIVKISREEIQHLIEFYNSFEIETQS